MITVSTAWNAMKHASGEMVVQELIKLGFSSFELSVKLSEDMVEEIESILLQIEVATLHNYCPVPRGPRENGGGDFYLLSSPDEEERARAVEASTKTLDWAQRMGARAVVFHFGRVDMGLPAGEDSSFSKILQFRAADRQDEADNLLRQDLALREERKGPYLDAALRSMRELVDAAGGKVQIGVETRYHYYEIPSIDEIQLFLDEVQPKAGGYWHDFGHAYINDLVGAASHEDFLTRYGSRTIGMHVHDVKGIDDHGPLTHGTIDFARYLKLIPREALSVLEIHGGSAEELVESRNIWQKLLAGTRPGA